MEKKERKMTTAANWAFWFGWMGAHRYYTGYKTLGIIQTLTLGGLGLWSSIDLFSILFNKYKDADGNKLVDYNKKVAIIYGIFAIGLIISKIAKEIH